MDYLVKTSDTFKNELNLFKKGTEGLAISSFTKHGSGDIKLGKNHFFPYEPEKYKDWAKQENIDYLYGNGICYSEEDLESENDFFSKMFWIHNDYRKGNLTEVEEIISIAQNTDVPIIIQPSNFIAKPYVNKEFEKIVQLAKQHSIPWVV